jgi:DNA-3-methyladenine glycosylase
MEHFCYNTSQYYMKKVLSKTFFERKVVQVAEELIGKFIVREIDGKVSGYKIIETEAYDGEKDLACHASKGRTKRTEVLYGRAGHLYVYLVYGMHYLLNVVADADDYPAGVLIRGIETKSGEKIFGPGRVAKYLKIDKAFHGKLAHKDIKVWFEDRGQLGALGAKLKIKKGPRVGVEYAGPLWSKKPYRFLLVD